MVIEDNNLNRVRGGRMSVGGKVDNVYYVVS